MVGLQPVKGTRLKYSYLTGTGGIGSGMFFNLEGNHTIGRNESRLGRLVPIKDYCKLHIIAHYISVLLNAGNSGQFEVYPLGMVGDDEEGKRLVDEMKHAGMDVKDIRKLPDYDTLFSVCFQYPDKTGGNITTADSASSRISPGDIDAFFNEFEKEGKEGLVLAVPEVPLNTRIQLLKAGRARGSFTAASVLSSEVDEFRRLSGLNYIDLLAVNIDEAAAISGIGQISQTSLEIVESCVKTLEAVNPEIMIIITDGRNGSYGYCKERIEHYPAPEVKVAGTGGAGDAFLAGVLCGLCCDLPFLKGRSDAYFSETPLESAMELGTILAGISVTSPDSIHKGVCAEFIYDFIGSKNISLSSKFNKMFSS